MSVKKFLVLSSLCILCTLSIQDVEEMNDDYNPNEEFPSMDTIPELNPDYTEDGNILLEGDIAVPLKEQETKGVINVATLWPNGQISFNFHSSVNDEQRTNILKAIERWENKTCLRFTERNLDLSYIRFRADKEGCWSFIGRMNSPFAGQDVNIGKGCNYVNLISHEIGHAIGFYHEQSRTDRDKYITILWDNMSDGKRSQFDRGLESPRGVEYDYTSIMHYGSMAFSERHFEKNTLTSKNPHHQVLIGSGKDLSFRDAKLASVLYSCSTLCPNYSNSSMCQNGGFLAPYRRDGEPCVCECPPSTAGEYCETVVREDYYEPQPCGGNITEETTIQTPSYPERSPFAEQCSWWIQAPPNQTVDVEFLDFSFRPRHTLNTSRFQGRCVHESVEMRVFDTNDGEMLCAEDIPPGTVIHSTGRQFVIIIHTIKEAQKGRGLKANVHFVQATNNTSTDSGFNFPIAATE